MQGENLKPIQEVSLPQDQVGDLVEKIQQNRGDLFEGLDNLRAGKGKYIKIFVNSSNPEPTDTIIATARWIADGNREGNFPNGVYSRKEWSKFGIIEVDNFDTLAIQQAVEQYSQGSIGINGDVDSERVGMIDLTNPDTNRIKFGDVSLIEGKMTSVTIDKGMI